MPVHYRVRFVVGHDRALWMLAFNNIYVNLDSYSGGIGHNHYLYQDDNGRFNNIVWDLNQSFASFKTTGSTHDLADGNLLNIYPNPTHHVLTIESPRTPLSKITLFNVIGQVVKSIQDVDNQIIRINVGDLVEGIYFLKAEGYTLRKILVTKE